MSKDNPFLQIAGVSVSAANAELGVAEEQFAAVAKTLCGFPSFFAAPLFRRIRSLYCADGEVTKHQNYIPLSIFVTFWKDEMENFDHVDRLFRLLCKRKTRPPDASKPHHLMDGISRKGIEPDDFMPYMEELLAFHPGLAFLESTPEFQVLVLQFLEPSIGNSSVHSYGLQFRFLQLNYVFCGRACAGEVRENGDRSNLLYVRSDGIKVHLSCSFAPQRPAASSAPWFTSHSAHISMHTHTCSLICSIR